MDSKKIRQKLYPAKWKSPQDKVLLTYPEMIGGEEVVVQRYMPGTSPKNQKMKPKYKKAYKKNK